MRFISVIIKKMKTVIRIIILVIIICLISVGVFFLFNTGSENVGEKITGIITKNGGETTNQIEENIDPEIEKIREKFNTEESIIINTNMGEVVVENFYKSATFITERGDAEIKSTNNYTISYNPEFSSFFIVITSENIEDAIRVAEGDILNVLKITKLQSCMLNIKLSIEKSFDPDRTYTNPFYISFCPPK